MSAVEVLPTPALGQCLGQYRLVRWVGAGAMGSVYEAEHRTLRKRVAIKVLHGSAVDSGLRERFLREAETAARIRHPHVVDITDAGQANGIAYMVMEYLEGETLDERIARDGALPARLFADILTPVVAAIEESHRQGVIHLDIKSSNIFLARSVTGAVFPKILDFGISKTPSRNWSQLTAENTLVGTPCYLAPERLRTKAATREMDQYSLGVVMYEAATGVNPFESYSPLLSLLDAVAKGSFLPPNQLAPGLSPCLQAIILRAMARAPEQRYPQLSALGAELVAHASPATQAAWKRYFAALSSSHSLQVKQVTETGPMKKPTKRRPPLWAAGSVISLIAVACWLTPAVCSQAQPAKRSGAATSEEVPPFRAVPSAKPELSRAKEEREEPAETAPPAEPPADTKAVQLGEARVKLSPRRRRTKQKAVRRKASTARTMGSADSNGEGEAGRPSRHMKSKKRGHSARFRTDNLDPWGGLGQGSQRPAESRVGNAR